MSGQTETVEETITRHVPMWKVIFHNDNKTTMEFVVTTLIAQYGKDPNKAFELTMEIHETGQGVAGTYPREVAEFKQEQTISLARGQGFPLCVTIEPDE